MRHMGITAKIWRSIGVFVLGYVLSTVLGQVQGLNTETKLGTTSESLFPAAQQSQEAEAAFQRMVKGFGEAVMVQDVSGVDRAVEEGQQVVRGLTAVAGTQGLSAERSAGARKLAALVGQFLGDAQNTYRTVLSNPAAMTPDMQQHMRDLATQTDAMKTSLGTLTTQCSADLRRELGGLRDSSAHQRWLNLAVFGITLVVAAIIVNLTIRLNIMRPILHVITGVQTASDEASQASSRISESGEIVAKDSQEQAACIEETSATLEEISATTRQNASRATEADGLMRGARQKVEKAAQAMNDLTTSMAAISKSSDQVAGVLKSIDEIAFHTNILALNAAVEAARAGQAGAGFSVVADEVRSLAQRAAEAARRSADIIEKTITDVGRGVELVAVAHGAFDEVSSNINDSGRVVAEIAVSSEEQARGVANIGQAISKIEAVTQHNAAHAQQTADSAVAMSSQMQSTQHHLKELIQLVGLKQS